MKSIKQMSMEELAAYVCSELEKEGIETVLSGGSYSYGLHKRQICSILSLG
jgi:hypothetical protein